MSNSIPLSEIETSPAAKFERIGDSHKGRIVAIDKRQQTDINNVPLWFDAAHTQPRMQWIITIEKSNGERVAFYAKGGKFKAVSGSGESMLSAVGSAVRAAGAASVDIGADLGVAHTGMAEAQAGKNAAKLYTAQYWPAAAASVPVGDLFSDES